MLRCFDVMHLTTYTVNFPASSDSLIVALYITAAEDWVMSGFRTKKLS